MAFQAAVADPNAWHRKTIGTRLRKPDAARALIAARNAGLTLSEFVRHATLKELARLGVTAPVNTSVNDRAQILAISAPLKAVQAQTKTRGNIEAFRQQAASDNPSRSDSVSRETFGTQSSVSMGMKDSPPRL